MRIGALVTLITVSLACDTSEPAKQKLAPAAADPAPAKVEAPAAVEPAPAPAATVGSMSTTPDGAPRAADTIDLARFPPPPWFTPQLFAGATVRTQGSSAPDPDGLFASHMLFDLAAGTSAQQCIDDAIAKIGPAIPTFGAPEGGDGGRLTVRGDGEHYKVTLVCGVVDGKSVASVNFRWTKAP